MFLALILAALQALLALVVTRFLARRTRLSEWKIKLLAGAVPLPALMWALCSYLIVSSMTATPEECGVDACGMTMMAAMFMATLALIPFGVGFACSAVVVRRLKQRGPNSGLAEIFE